MLELPAAEKLEFEGLTQCLIYIDSLCSRFIPRLSVPFANVKGWLAEERKQALNVPASPLSAASAAVLSPLVSSDLASPGSPLAALADLASVC
jgi:hypothetical protein